MVSYDVVIKVVGVNEESMKREAERIKELVGRVLDADILVRRCMGQMRGARPVLRIKDWDQATVDGVADLG